MPETNEGLPPNAEEGGWVLVEQNDSPVEPGVVARVGTVITTSVSSTVRGVYETDWLSVAEGKSLEMLLPWLLTPMGSAILFKAYGFWKTDRNQQEMQATRAENQRLRAERDALREQLLRLIDLINEADSQAHTSEGLENSTDSEPVLISEWVSVDHDGGVTELPMEILPQTKQSKP